MHVISSRSTHRNCTRGNTTGPLTPDTLLTYLTSPHLPTTPNSRSTYFTKHLLAELEAVTLNHHHRSVAAGSSNLTSSNTSPNSHSAAPATSRQSAASNNMRSELSLKAARQKCSMADRRPLLQPNKHCQGRQGLYWHNCSPVTAEFLVSI